MNRLRLFGLSALALVGLSFGSAQAAWHPYFRPIYRPPFVVVSAPPVVIPAPVILPPAVGTIRYGQPVVVVPPRVVYRRYWR